MTPDAAACAHAEERGGVARGEGRPFLSLCGSHGRDGGDLAEIALEETLDLPRSSVAPSGLLPCVVLRIQDLHQWGGAGGFGLYIAV
jgi:hypothetical protein